MGAKFFLAPCFFDMYITISWEQRKLSDFDHIIIEPVLVVLIIVKLNIVLVIAVLLTETLVDLAVAFTDLICSIRIRSTVSAWIVSSRFVNSIPAIRQYQYNTEIHSFQVLIEHLRRLQFHICK